MGEPSYRLSPDGKAITCLYCNRTSLNANDVSRRYCGWCHVFHESGPPPGAALGGGNYDGISDRALLAAAAEMAVVIILGGEKGDGFSLSVRAEKRELVKLLPGLLRASADLIESSRGDPLLQ